MKCLEQCLAYNKYSMLNITNNIISCTYFYVVTAYSVVLLYHSLANFILHYFKKVHRSLENHRKSKTGGRAYPFYLLFHSVSSNSSTGSIPPSPTTP